MLRVDLEITRINVVALHDHFEDFRLMHRALLHEVQNLILNCDCLVHVVLYLRLQLILELAILLQELLILHWVGKVLVVLRQQVQLAVVDPTVVTVTKWVHIPDAAVFATTEQEQSVDLLVKVTPVKHMGQPGQTVGCIHERQSELPREIERIDKEEVPRHWDRAVKQDVWVFEVDS